MLDVHYPECENREIHRTESADAQIDYNHLAWTMVSEERVERALASFNPYKSPGHDMVFSIMLQKAGSKCHKLLRYVFSACIATAYTPSLWTHARVCFLPKPGKETYCKAKSFRPITLT